MKRYRIDKEAMRAQTQTTIVGIGILLSAMLAGIEAKADTQSEAVRLFDEGRALMLERRFPEACPKIAESQRLDPHVGTLLNLAACHEQLGKTATAWVEYQQALTAARAEGQADRERLAQQRIEVLEPRVPWLVLSVSAEPPIHGLSVTLDSAPILPVAWGKEMPVDPGEHLLTATAPQRVPRQLSFVLKESEHKTLAVPTLELVQEQPTAVPAPKPPPRSQGKEQPAPAPSRFSFELGVLVGYLASEGGRAEPRVEESAIPVRDLSSGADTSCAIADCSYTLPRSTAALLSVNLSASYALSDTVRLGARFLGGPLVGKGGGSLWALGPTLTLQITDTLWAGFSGLLGEARVGGYGEITGSARYSSVSGGSYMLDATIGSPGLGAGIEVGMKIAQLPHGSLGLSTMPFFLSGGGKGSLWCVPAGLSYRF